MNERIEEILDELDTQHPATSRIMTTRRRKTINAVALAQAEGRPISGENGVLGARRAKGIISERVWYSKQKDYFHHEGVRTAVAEITRLYRQQIAAEEEAALRGERAKRRTDRIRLVDAGKSRLVNLLQGMDTLEASPGAVATFMRTVFAEERTEFEPTAEQALHKVNLENLTDQQLAIIEAGGDPLDVLAKLINARGG